MKRKSTKILLSLALCTFFAIVVYWCHVFISSTSRNILVYLAFSLLSFLLCLFFIGLCIWLVYKIWYVEEIKKKVLILSAIISPIMMYILGFVVLILGFALGVWWESSI